MKHYYSLTERKCIRQVSPEKQDQETFNLSLSLSVTQIDPMGPSQVLPFPLSSDLAPL